MNKNRKEEIQKEIKALKRREDELFDARRKLGYIKLDKPRPSGYVRTLKLRDDISRREDFEVYEYLIEAFCKKAYSRDIKFITYKNGNKCEAKATIRKISQAEYDRHLPVIQKHFTPIEKIGWGGYITYEYYCTVPSYYFEQVTETNFIYRVKIHDELIEQELSEIQYRIDLLTNYNYRLVYNVNNSGLKWFTNYCNRVDRRKTKRAIKKAIDYDFEEDVNFPGRHRHAGKWLYW